MSSEWRKYLDFGQKEVSSRISIANQKTTHHNLLQLFFKLSKTELNPLKSKKVYAACCLLGVDFDCF